MEIIHKESGGQKKRGVHSLIQLNQANKKDT